MINLKHKDHISFKLFLTTNILSKNMLKILSKCFRNTSFISLGPWTYKENINYCAVHDDQRFNYLNKISKNIVHKCNWQVITWRHLFFYQGNQEKYHWTITPKRISGISSFRPDPTTSIIIRGHMFTLKAAGGLRTPPTERRWAFEVIILIMIHQFNKHMIRN